MSLFDRVQQFFTKPQEEASPSVEQIHEQPQPKQQIHETVIDEDMTSGSMFPGSIESIEESVVHHSPQNVYNLIMASNTHSDQILNELRASYDLTTTFNENEEMARDAVIGGGIEVLSEDASQIDERTGRVVNVESTDPELKTFLEDFLENNVDIASRIWTWTFDVVKHGDLKLRRREYYISSQADRIKSVYYEEVINPYKVTRIEYLGKVLGYRDEDLDEGHITFEKPEAFVHFLSSKNSHKEKVKLTYRNEDGEIEQVTCYKVHGVSMVDNARYLYRIVNLLDNMLVLARVARSTQYNLVKVEV